MTCQCGGKVHSRWVHWWQRMSARALHIEVTYYHGDDTSETKREVELEVPDWVYRPRCWIKGHERGPDRDCVFCRRVL